MRRYNVERELSYSMFYNIAKVNGYILFREEDNKLPFWNQVLRIIDD